MERVPALIGASGATEAAAGYRFAQSDREERMAGQRKRPSDAGVVSRLAGRGEDAITRLMDELGKNPRVTDALGKAMSAKGKVDDTTRKRLAQIGLAAADEVKDLRGRLDRLEKRLARIERQTTSGTGRETGGSRSAPARRSSGKAPSGTSPRSRRSSPGGDRPGPTRESSGSGQASSEGGGSPGPASSEGGGSPGGGSS